MPNGNPLFVLRFILTDSTNAESISSPRSNSIVSVNWMLDKLSSSGRLSSIATLFTEPAGTL